MLSCAQVIQYSYMFYYKYEHQWAIYFLTSQLGFSDFCVRIFACKSTLYRPKTRRLSRLPKSARLKVNLWWVVGVWCRGRLKALLFYFDF